MTQNELRFRNFNRIYNYDYRYNVSPEYPLGYIRLNVWKKGLYRLDRSEWNGFTGEFVCSNLDECFELAYKQFGF